MAKLKRKSCCCGATESNPCACMKKGIMKCSAKEPMCQCYKDLKKQGKHPEDLKKSFDLAWIVVKRDVRDPIHGKSPEATSMAATRGTGITPLRMIVRGGKTKKNEVVNRKEGDPTPGSKGNTKTDATASEKIIANKIKAVDKKLKIGGERGKPKQNS